MENPGECNVCFVTYNESEQRPRTLPCGHTFCSPCIGNMMEDGQLSCPTCRVHHPATSATQFPISYGIEAFVKQLEVMKLTQSSTVREAPEGNPPQAKPAVVNCPSSISIEATCQKQFTGISRKLRSLLDEQKSSVTSVVAGSQEVQSQLDQYRAQLADWKTQHLKLLDKLYDLVQQNKSALELLEQEDTRVLGMKTEGEEGKKQLEAVQDSMQAFKTAQEVVTGIDHADHCIVEVEDWMQKCQELFPDVNILTTTKKVRESTTMALEEVTTVIGEGEGTRMTLEEVNTEIGEGEGARMTLEEVNTEIGEGEGARMTLEEVNTEIGEGEGARMTLETEGATAGALETVLHLVDPTLSIIEKVQYITTQGKIKLEDLCRMRPPVKRLVEAGCVYGVQEDDGGLRSSRITLENGQLYLHCLRDQSCTPYARSLLVSEMVESLDPSSTLVFLDLSWPGSTKGRVHIRLSPDTSLARQFVLLCTGQHGHSYLNTVLFGVLKKGEPGEIVMGGDYEHNNGKGGAPLLPHSNHQYRKSGRAGTVWSGYTKDSEVSAQFVISTRDLKKGLEFPCVIGEVESGLEVVRAAVNHSDIRQVTVVDCGVVVSL